MSITDDRANKLGIIRHFMEAILLSLRYKDVTKVHTLNIDALETIVDNELKSKLGITLNSVLDVGEKDPDAPYSAALRYVHDLAMKKRREELLSTFDKITDSLNGLKRIVSLFRRK